MNRTVHISRNNYRARIYGSYARLHTRQPIGDMRLYKSSIREFDWRLKELLPKDKTVKCLDIACGAGFFLNYLKERGYQSITGVDVSPEQVLLAKQVCGNVHEEDIREFLTSYGKYNFISIFSFIEHLTRDEAFEFLDSVYNALEPGGRIILIAPNADSPFASHMRFGDITHEIIYNKSSLTSLMLACGFCKIQAYETGPVPHGIVSGIRWMLWKAIKFILSFYRLIEGGNSKGWIFTTEFIAVAEKPVEENG